MARTLKAVVHIQDEHGMTHVFGPETDVPKWARESITNPNAWDGEAEAEAAAAPPRAGKGSGLETWTVYATGLGIAVPEDATREEIFELVDAHND